MGIRESQKINLSRHDMVSDLTGREFTLELPADANPEPYKWPAAKDMPKLYVHEDEADALTAFLAGDPEPLKALYAAKPKSGNGTGDNGKFAATVREWAKSANVAVTDRGRVAEETYLAYFKANTDATAPDGSTKQAQSAYAKAHPATA